jgi:hydrogenase/urease accessory protein HupE
MRRLFGYLLLGFIGPLCLRAHDPGLSTTQVALRTDAIAITVGFAPADAKALLPARVRIRAGSALENFEVIKPSLLALASNLWEVRGQAEVLRLDESRVSMVGGNSVIFELTYPRAPGPSFTLRSLTMDRLPPGHRDYLTVSDEQGRLIMEQLVDGSTPAITVALPLGGAPAAPPAFWGFLELGIRHIWTGYDHLLFLFGLLLVCRRFKSIVAIISCFTIAHSLTLALATLNLVHFSSRLVEPAIAASIVFVGVENLARGGSEPAGRWALTFLFGLVHGFGFASVLRELGVGSGGRGLAVPLLSFNLGVEVGQITIAAIVLPLVWQLRRGGWFVRYGALGMSAAVAAAGLFWFFQRTLFS